MQRRQKKEGKRVMNKKAFTALFTLISTIVNIVFTLLTIIVLSGIFILIFKYTKSENGNILILGLGICFVVGMISNIFFFTKFTNWVVKKFNLSAKLDNRILGKVGAAKPVEKKKTKTRLPDSVKQKDDEDPWLKDGASYQSFGIEELQYGIAKKNEEVQALIAERDKEAQEYDEAKKSGKKTNIPKENVVEEEKESSEPVSFGREELEKLKGKDE